MPTGQKHSDAYWMGRAIALARLGEGCTRPNPPVGAVVVRSGRVLGEGWHRRAGMPHAEVEALHACSGSVKNATMYVTLEPCCTFGRTPPCTDLLIQSGIKRVVVGCDDPNPSHASRGFRILSKAGIAVTHGVCEQECRRLIEPFSTRVRANRPFVTLKLAMTLDGRIADRTGASKWITGVPAREAVQELRRRADAILVGAGTIRADNPSLRCRLPNASGRWRIVLDGHGRISPTAQIFTDRWADTTLVATSRCCPIARQRAWSRSGARVWSLPVASNGHIKLPVLLQRLAGEGIMHLLCEGGGNLAGALLKADLVDELILFYAPVMMGDAKAVPGMQGADFLLTHAPRFHILEAGLCGSDLRVVARPVSRLATTP